MESMRYNTRLHPAWWTLILLAVIALLVFVTLSLFFGTFAPSVPVTLTSERTGLVMEDGAKVKMRGVLVGRVSSIEGGKDAASLKLEIFPDQVKYIPANVTAQIRATTVFGAKYVDLSTPATPVRSGSSAGAVIRVAERFHRGQHGVRESCECARQDRAGKAQRGADGAGGRAAWSRRADRAGDHGRQPSTDGDQSRAPRRSGETGRRSRDSAIPIVLRRRTSSPCLDAAATTSATISKTPRIWMRC